VVLATDLQADSVGAARFAQQVATARGRDVVVAHIVPSTEDAGAFIPAATAQQLYDQLGLERRQSLEKWKADVGLATSPSAIASGEPVERLLGIANAEGAAMIVSGSRRTSPVARLFTASVGTALASYAPCAVAVVPGDY
jgi:nucleotide-binding universal stress UspA family protein